MKSSKFYTFILQANPIRLNFNLKRKTFFTFVKLYNINQFTLN